VTEDLGNGIEHVTASNYHLIRFDPSRVELVLDDNPDDHLPLVHVADWKPECLVAINGGGFTEYSNPPLGVPLGTCASKGHIYATESVENSIYFDINGAVAWTAPGTIYDAVNYPNKLISAGVARTDLDNVIADPRTMVGELAGTQYWISTTPMTKQQACNLGASLGLTELGNMDGGQSTSMRIKGQMVNGTGARAVPTHLGIKLKGAGMQYKVVWAKGAAERPQPNTSGVALASHVTGDVVDAVQNNIPDNTDPTNVNKKWCKLANGHYMATDYPDSNGAPAVRMQLVTPPPPTDSMVLTFDFRTNVVHIERNTNGTVLTGDVTLK
jgi:hypothetical protein